MYEPQEDSYLLKEAIEKYCKENKVDSALDMGTGSGIQAEQLATFCKQVTAVEIDEEVIKQIQNKLNKKIILLKSDLFQNLKKQKFDLIVFNPPYLPEEEFLKVDIETIGGKSGEELTIKFLEQAKNYLNKDGTILFIASSLANLKNLEQNIKKLGYISEIIAKKHISYEDIIVMQVKNEWKKS